MARVGMASRMITRPRKLGEPYRVRSADAPDAVAHVMFAALRSAYWA